MSEIISPQTIVLASSSPTRQRLLQAAGVPFKAIPASVDETAIRETLMTEGQQIDPLDVAEVLARAKAEDVSAKHSGCVVIGADQVLACDGQIISKPQTIDAARDTLLTLRGRTHQLHSAVAIAEDGETKWAFTDTADLTMRQFSPAFLGKYLAATGRAVLDSVGAYQLEGLGIQLFERIEGDFFTILGLPMLPLLRELRARKLIPE
jgi:septum formation protein